MKNETDQINIAFFQRDHQLLSNEAMLHRRNLMVFSATSLFLYLINSYYLMHLKKPLVFSSFFGVSLVKDDYVSASIIILALLTIILYELLMFRFHFNISLTAYTDRFNTEKNIWSGALSDITQEIDSKIRQQLNDVYAGIPLIKDLLLKNKWLVEELLESDLIKKKQHSIEIMNLHESNSQMAAALNSIEEFSKRNKSNIPNLNKFIYSLEYFRIKSKKFTTQFHKFNSKDIGELCDNVSSTLYAIERIIVDSKFNNLNEILFDEIVREIDNKNKMTRDLIEPILELSYDVSKQKFVEFTIPSAIGIISIVVGIALIYFNY